MVQKVCLPSFYRHNCIKNGRFIIYKLILLSQVAIAMNGHPTTPEMRSYTTLWNGFWLKVKLNKLRRVELLKKLHPCHTGSHSVNCHTTQVNTPRLNLSQTGWCSTYLLGSDGRLSWRRLPVTHRDGLPTFVTHLSIPTRQCTAGSRTRDLLITSPTP